VTPYSFSRPKMRRSTSTYRGDPQGGHARDRVEPRRRRRKHVADGCAGATRRPRGPARARPARPRRRSVEHRHLAAPRVQVAGARSSRGGRRWPRPRRRAPRSGLVDDGAVVEDVEQLVVGGGRPDLGDEDLDLHRLHLVGEDLAEDLGVLVGQAAGVDVLAAVGVALEVGVADPGDAQLVELVVLADAGEGDAVVDLADLAQRGDGFSAQMRMPSA
jgi:hypothetical protein